MFLAHAAGLPVHVWVSETRPRLQGANLTAWELAARGVPHTLFVDGASGLLMRRGDVDVVIVGADRVAANGDVCNKIGTYDKALAARRQRRAVLCRGAVADARLRAAFRRRDPDRGARRRRGAERHRAATRRAATATVRVAPAGTRAVNYAFDVTPARLVAGLVTERGVARRPDRASAASRRAVSGARCR